MGPKKGQKVSKWQPLPSDTSILQVTVVPGFDDHTVRIEDLTLKDLENCQKFIDQSNKTLEVENTVIERYLLRMDPSLMLRMDQVLEAAATAMQKAEKAQLGTGNSALSIVTSKDFLDVKGNVGRGFSQQIYFGPKLSQLTMAEKGPKVQPAQKIEIVNREIEELRNALEEFRQNARHSNYILRCRNEELSTRLNEIIEERNYFENKLLVEGIDPLTGKLPGEKFVRYLEMKLQSEESEIDKIRMKTSSTKHQLKRVEQQLTQKAELGEVLHAIDFEQVSIENRGCQERLDETILHLTDIKKIHGRCGTMLNFNLKKLQGQMRRLNDLRKSIETKEKMIQQLREDEGKVNEEVEVALKSVQRIKELMNSYTVPDVMDYIHKKAEVHDLKKEVKICVRKLKLKNLALESQAHKLKTNLDASVSLMRTKSLKKLGHY